MRMKAANIKSIVIVGRRWFERTNGNTYHSVDAYVDGKLAFREPFTYGYGDQYRWTALSGLEKAGYLPGIERYPNGGSESLSRYCERHGITLADEVVDVPRKRDL
jgi:hypothetical protein